MIGTDAVPPAEPSHLVRMAFDGITIHQTLYAAAKLGVADLVADGPRTTANLSGVLEVNEPALYRVLRFLAGRGVFEETAPRTFANNALSQYLRTGVPGSVRAILVFRGGSYCFPPYGEILYTIQTGLPGRTKIHGMEGFEFLRQHPEEARIFDDAMTNMSMLFAPSVSAAYDFGAWGSLMDIGGGNGVLLAAILRSHPGLRGVLADQPHVLERARQRGFLGGELASRSAFEPCDFFQAVPSGCRAYLMKHVIHDWDDGQAREILKNCRRAVPADGALLLVEWPLPESGRTGMGAVADITMLVATGGRERTVDEYRDLFDASAFRLSRVVPAGDLMLVEARPV